MKKGFCIKIVSLGVALLLISINIFAQLSQEETYLEYKAVVKDVDGLPVKDAWIYVNENMIFAKTDVQGNFSIRIPEGVSLLVEAEGFEPQMFDYDSYIASEELLLEPSVFYYGSGDDVNIAFGKVKRGSLIGAISLLEPDEIREYDNKLMLSDALLGRVPGLLGTDNIRGVGNALFVVDGLPRDISTIKLSEVEQVTVLKDINSAMLYGSAGSNGVILVTTKRGKANKQTVNVSAHYGVSTPLAMPKYLSSADYMELYNEARENDGLSILWSDTEIENYRTGDIYRYPDVDYYSDEYLRYYKPFYNVESEFSGGNEFATYYTNVGWNQTNGYLDFGEGKNEHTTDFNVRGNVDVNVSPFIKSSIDAVVNFNQYYGPTGTSYWESAAEMKPNEFTPLLPISRIDPENQLLLARKNDINGEYLLGGTQGILTNPIAQVYSGGRISPQISRTFSFNQRNLFDLGFLLEGLTFHTNISFDLYTTYIQAINNSYSVYEPVWGEDNSIIDLIQYGIDERTGTQEVSEIGYMRRLGFYGMFDYKRTFSDVHEVSGSLMGQAYKLSQAQDIQGIKHANLGLRVNYLYDRKYMVNFSSAYVNSVKLAPGNRTAFSPSVAVAWVMSSEDFMTSADRIDYLKLRMIGGLANSDLGIDGFYYYDNVYSTTNLFRWYEGQWENSSYTASYGDNNNLSFEKRKELDIGLESILFNHAIGIDANVFWIINDDQVSRLYSLYPGYYTDFIPYENYNKTAYRGAEVGLTWVKQLGEFSITAGINGLYSNSEVLEMDETYKNAYQYRTGRPADALFGLESDGFFMDEEDVAGHTSQAFGNVQPGDIKYIDQNNDGIVDSEDEIQIGRTQSPFSYGLHIKLNYKNLSLFAIGNGRFGADSYLNGDYYWVDGDDKYTDAVLDRWTESSRSAASYPRLSSISNNNNYRCSTFWLYQNNYFIIDRVQITYRLPDKLNRRLRMKSSSVYVDGSNVFRISKHRDVLDLNVGGEPYSRSFSLGMRFMF